VYHELPVATPVPDRAAAVGVVLDASGTRSVRRHTVAPHDVAEVLARFSGTVLVGSGLVGDDVVVGVAGQPLTGLWLELVRRLPEWRESGEEVMLAEYDPSLGQLFTATLRFG
jgi:hypothetical protein